MNTSIWIFTLALAMINLTDAKGTILKQKGDDLKLSCQVHNDQVKWKVNGVVTPQSVSRSVGENTTSTLDKTNLTTKDTGVYECLAAGTAGAGTTNASLIDSFTVSIISITGENSSLVENKTAAVLTCSVEMGDIEATRPQWQRNGEVVNDTDRIYASYLTNTSSFLTIKDPESSDAGLYMCKVTVINSEGKEEVFQRAFGLDVKPEVLPIEKLRSRVEGEDAKIECKVTGYPTPEIKWYRELDQVDDGRKLVEYDDRVNATENPGGVPNSILSITKLKIKTDRGDYTCVAINSLGNDEATATLKVKDKLAAVWPFLGICAEVAILCSIIFIFEKRRNRRMEEEEKDDAIKETRMTQANGMDEKELRQRNTAPVKA